MASMKDELVDIVAGAPGITLAQITPLSRLAQPGRQLGKLVVKDEIALIDGGYHVVAVPAPKVEIDYTPDADLMAAVTAAVDSSETTRLAVLTVLADRNVSRKSLEAAFRNAGKRAERPIEKMMSSGLVFYVSDLNDDLLITPPGRGVLARSIG